MFRRWGISTARRWTDCQIRYDSHLGRGLADTYLLLFDGRVAGYGGVLNRYDAGRLTEFYVLPHARVHRQRMFRELLAASGATQKVRSSRRARLSGLWASVS